MDKKILTTALILGLSSVVLGAFASHALKDSLDSGAITSFQVGIRYQMYHALLLLFLSQTKFFSNQIKKRAFFLIILGVVLFSGSIYLLSTNNLTSFEFKKIGFLTPIGGVVLILSWIILIFSLLLHKKNRE
jgi:uncharacterized membrane protein YgdD (TMEM256/DUF423 family)